jgi:hypothetical protein
MADAITGSWFDDSSDETWSFFADGTFEHEWHSQGDTHTGTYELTGAELRLNYDSGFERVWQIDEISGTALIWRTGDDRYTLRKIM